jgi:hypothetical protein
MVRVFVSSTSEDLKSYRAVARQVIGNLRWHAVMMEDFGASAAATVPACLGELANCQLMLLVVAFRKGWTPTVEQGGNGQDSVTALELAFARSRQIPVLALLASDDSWPLKLCDGEPGLAWVKSFRSDLNLPADFFGYEDPGGAEEKRLPAFREMVRKTLLSYQERRLAELAGAAAGRSGGLDYYSSARDSLLEGSCLPFVGGGIFGDGPLSVPALARALAGGKEMDTTSLATVAEYRERFVASRDRFLNELHRIVEDQSRAAQPPPALEMLVGLEHRPPLVVATTHDQMLEDALSKAGRPFVVVTHVVRSLDGEHDGKILVMRRDAPPVFCHADGVDLDPADFVVYRPLGSPLLHDRLDPALEIDTVVITETDHLTFLGRLENQHMQVPTRFSRFLQRRPLLFLGYGLDVWHYRLVMHVFQSAGGRANGAHVMAIRQPASEMESLTWQRLGADVVQLEVNEFARRVVAPVAPA